MRDDKYSASIPLTEEQMQMFERMTPEEMRAFERMIYEGLKREMAREFQRIDRRLNEGG